MEKSSRLLYEVKLHMVMQRNFVIEIKYRKPYKMFMKIKKNGSKQLEDFAKSLLSSMLRDIVQDSCIHEN